jgi:hypothetical protein
MPIFWTMRVPTSYPSLLALALLVLGACHRDGDLGAVCEAIGDCDENLQCVRNICAAKCKRASDCGDGFACQESGLCIESRAVEGNSCDSETDCSAGLACVPDLKDNDDDGRLLATCVEDNNGRPVGAGCINDGQCRNGTCALGRCVDLCVSDRDCPDSTVCTTMPRVEADGALFRGCLLARGLLTWDIPVSAPSADVLVPVPAHARSISLLMAVDDNSQLVGANLLTTPRGTEIYNRLKDYYSNPLRHRPLPSISVLQIPSSSAVKLEPGAYRLALTSLRPNGVVGSATPRLTASVRVGDGAELSLHFHFVDLSDHPCRAAFGPEGILNASSAPESDPFQSQYLTQIRDILRDTGISIGAVTYDDLHGSPSLDNLTPESTRSILPLSRYASGINVYFVRSMSPAGSRASGPTPGAAGIRGTAASGVVISIEPLCYRSWSQVARTTTHQLARYLGLFPNRDITGQLDPINDSDASSDNLMFYSELGGIRVSAGQRTVLMGSPALQ